MGVVIGITVILAAVFGVLRFQVARKKRRLAQLKAQAEFSKHLAELNAMAERQRAALRFSSYRSSSPYSEGSHESAMSQPR